MRKSKLWLTGCAVALTLVSTSLTTFAATIYSTPAEAVAAITETQVEDVIEQRENGKSYGTIADEAGKLEEFQKAMLEIKSAVLEECVLSGTLTREQADDYLSVMEEQQTLCNGSNLGPCGIGRGNGGGFGYGRGAGRGMGYGYRANGACLYY